MRIWANWRGHTNAERQGQPSWLRRRGPLLTLPLLALLLIAALVAAGAPARLRSYLAGAALDRSLAWPAAADALPAARDRERLARAVADLRAAGPADPASLRKLAYAEAALGNWLAAADAADQALAGQPDSLLIAWERGLIYEQLAAQTELAAAEPLTEALAGGDIGAPPYAVGTPFCQPGRPDRCFVAPTRFTLPVAGAPAAGADSLPTLFMHPPSRASQRLTVPAEAPSLAFALGLHPAARGWGSNGATFRVWAAGSGEQPALVYERTLDGPAAEAGWAPDSADLSAWAGRPISLTLEVDGGPGGDLTGDWFGWGDLRLLPADAAALSARAPLGQLRSSWQAAAVDYADIIRQARLARSKGDLPGAERWYRRAARLDPQQPEAWYQLGLVLTQRGEPAATAALRRAAEVDPDLRDPWYRLGALALAEGQPAQALEQLRAGRTLSEGTVGRSNFSYQIGIAQLRSPGDNRGAAANSFEQAIAADDYRVDLWQRGDAHHQLGHLLLAGGSRDAAIGAYRNALALNPDSYWVRLSLGRALWEDAQGDEARAIVEAASRLEPQQKQAYQLLARFAEEAGDAAAARAWHSQVLALDPDDSASRQALERLP